MCSGLRNVSIEDVPLMKVFECSLAWAELNLILAKVVWNFDLELSERTKEDWSDQKVWLMHEGAPLYLKISPRAT